jgi:hypothetical protein
VQDFVGKRWLALASGWALVAVLLVGVCGCSEGAKGPTGPTGNITGKVTLGGEPLNQGAVEFVRGDAMHVGSAIVSSSGEFKFEQPMPVGDYLVAVLPPQEDAAAGEEQDAKREDVMKQVPEKYWAHTTSGLTATVKEGDNPFTFELEKTE